MRHARFDHLLMGTALVTALALTGLFQQRFGPTGPGGLGRHSGAAASADLPPPSVKDITPDKSADKPAQTANATDLTSSVSGATSAKATSADSAIADKLREQITAGKFDRVLGGKKDRTSVEAFYSTREFAPLWIADGAMSERCQDRRPPISQASRADGLDPADYPLRRSNPAPMPTRSPKPK